MGVYVDIKAIITGLWTTWKHILRRPVTIQYPEEKRTPYPRFRAPKRPLATSAFANVRPRMSLAGNRA